MEVNCHLKMVKEMVTLANHVIALAELTLREAFGTLEIFATSFC